MASNRERLQRETCQYFGAEYLRTSGDDKLGVSENVKSGPLPINGLRHRPKGDNSGWFIWAGGVLSKDPDFFQPLHAIHVQEWCPEVERFLGLAPGWRFLVAGDYQDVWFDPELIKVT